MSQFSKVRNSNFSNRLVHDARSRSLNSNRRDIPTPNRSSILSLPRKTRGKSSVTISGLRKSAERNKKREKEREALGNKPQYHWICTRDIDQGRTWPSTAGLHVANSRSGLSIFSLSLSLFEAQRGQSVRKSSTRCT